jgi:hypothetical protein
VRRLIAAEFAKLATTRLWLWLLAGSIALTALYVSLTIAFSDSRTPKPCRRPPRPVSAWRSPWPRAGRARWSPCSAPSVSPASTATAPPPPLLATPRRSHVVTAKLITYGLVGVGYATACIAVTAAIALPWLAARGIEVPPAGNGIPATLAGVAAAVAIYAVLGRGAGGATA